MLLVTFLQSVLDSSSGLLGDQMVLPQHPCSAIEIEDDMEKYDSFDDDDELLDDEEDDDEDDDDEDLDDDFEDDDDDFDDDEDDDFDDDFDDDDI